MGTGLCACPPVPREAFACQRSPRPEQYGASDRQAITRASALPNATLPLAASQAAAERELLKRTLRRCRNLHLTAIFARAKKRLVARLPRWAAGGAGRVAKRESLLKAEYFP